MALAPIDAELTISQLTEALLLKLKEGTHVVDTKSQCISESELVNMESRLHEITSLSKTIRNSLRPINKLSPEVLAIIFSMVLPHIPSIRPTFKISFKHWVFISHVCRYWRATALSFASLWCGMDIRGNCDNDLASMFLRRSSSAPLKVYYYPCGMDEDDEELLSMFRDEAQASRLKELHMWTPYMHGVPEKMWELCQSPAPILESLTVSLNAYDVNGVALPRLFEGYTPRLRHLTLRHYSTWPHNRFENLTHVSLHAQPLMGRYPVREFLEFLGRSPLLEELVLIEAGPDMDSVISDDNRSLALVDPVSLGRLRNIEIGGWESAEMVTTFLSYLLIPSDAVKLIWGQWTPSDNGLSLLFDPSSRLSADLRSVEKITISVVSSEQTAVHITPSHLHISGPYSPNLYGAESLVNVQELHLLTIRAARYSADECRAVFRCLPSLKTLVLSASFDLLSAFSPLGLEMDQVPLCPKLESIWVCTNGEGASLLLLILAHQRAKHGMPIRHLKIPITGGSGGGGREEDVNENVERLKSVVEDVQPQVMDIRPSPVKPVAGSWRW